MSKPLCDICGKPADQYPNWILSRGEQMHVGCMASNRRDLVAHLKSLLDAMDALFLKPDPEQFKPGDQEYVMDSERLSARAAIEKVKGQP